MYTVHTMESMLNLRVHIAPVGFEIDRVVVPAVKMKADLVYLVVDRNIATDKSTKFQTEIIKKLKRKKIKTKIVYANRLKLFDIIRVVKEIILDHRDDEFYVNVASGSKIHAIACMMACMVLKECDNLQPFYAEPESYAAFEGKQQSFGIKDTIALPTYEIQTPKPKLLAALKIVSEQPKQKITKKDMAQIAEEQEIITINAEQENHSQARFASLDKNIIAPLEKEWKFIEVEKIGRNRWIKITQEGIDAAEFLI